MSRKTLWLHVGMDKTGTSSIQAFLHRNRDTLAHKHGVAYPKTGQWVDHSHHALSFTVLDENPGATKTAEDLIAQLVAEIPQNCARAVVSSELLFKVPSRANGLLRIRGLLEKFADVKVIVYVRRQDLWVQSRHKHSIVSGQELTLRQLSEPHFCDYFKWIGEWGDVVGHGNVIVRSFDKARLYKGDLAADFLHLLDIDAGSPAFVPLKIANESLGNIETEMKRVTNDLGLKGDVTHDVNRLLITHTSLNKNARNGAGLLSNEQRRDLIVRYQAANDAIAAKYTSFGETPLFSAFSPEAVPPWNAAADCSEEDIAELADYVQSAVRVREAVGAALKNTAAISSPKLATATAARFLAHLKMLHEPAAEPVKQRQRLGAMKWPWRN